MKTKTHILLAAIALVPGLALAGDLTGTNTVTGLLSSANGNQNTVTGFASFATGQLSFVPGAADLVAGQQNFVQGNWNTVFGYANTTGAAGNFNIIGGTGNTATASRSLIIGNNSRDNGRNGSVILTDSNPFGIRTNALPLQSPANDSFTTAFNGGYFMRTNHGQGGFPNSGLFIIAEGTQSATIGRPARVGINTTTPRTTLDVASTGISLPASTFTYFTQFNTSTLSTGTGSSFPAISIRTDGYVGAFGFVAISDERVKSIQGRSDSAADLRKISEIEITDFQYKDVIGKGNRSQKKVIAQQVEKVFPQAVNQSTDVVPDIYKKAAIKSGWVELATDLKVGDRVRLITEKGNHDIHEVLEVRKDKFRTDFTGDDNVIFVYGREVKDFRTVDYEAIAMLNVSATQQIKKEKDAEVKALRDENAALRSKLETQEKRLAGLEAKDRAREARLARLEAAASPAPARTIPASLELKTANK